MSIRTRKATPDSEPVKIAPQEGQQAAFAATSADIAVYGGAAGAGKTFSLLIEPIRHIQHSGFRGLIMRKTYADLMQQGGLHDAASELYPQLGGKWWASRNEWKFPSGATVGYGHCERDVDVTKFQGAELTYLGFDEVTHFRSGEVFWYLQTRLRSRTDVVPYVRATCNPDPDSFVRELIDWWLDEDGFPIMERSGVVRYFTRSSLQLIWGDTVEDLVAQGYKEKACKSFTFVPGALKDNKILQELNPEYETNLLIQSHVTQQQLLAGNWNIRAIAGGLFQGWIKKDDPPLHFEAMVRFWDIASSTVGDPTAGVLMGKIGRQYWILDVVTGRWASEVRDAQMINTAVLDDNRYQGRVRTWIERQPGAAGLDSMRYHADMLARYGVQFDQPRTDKVTRAQPLAAQAAIGNVYVLNRHWTSHFLNEAAAFPTKGVPDDQVDASSGAFNKLFSEVTYVPASYRKSGNQG